jgi:hypothetical protein
MPLFFDSHSSSCVLCSMKKSIIDFIVPVNGQIEII